MAVARFDAAQRQPKRGAAMAWLRSYMTPGTSYAASEVLSAAERAGHARRTVQEAAERLGIEKRRVYAHNKAGVARWEWTIGA